MAPISASVRSNASRMRGASADSDTATRLAAATTARERVSPYAVAALRDGGGVAIGRGGSTSTPRRRSTPMSGWCEHVPTRRELARPVVPDDDVDLGGETADHPVRTGG